MSSSDPGSASSVIDGSDVRPTSKAAAVDAQPGNIVLLDWTEIPPADPPVPGREKAIAALTGDRFVVLSGRLHMERSVEDTAAALKYEGGTRWIKHIADNGRFREPDPTAIQRIVSVADEKSGTAGDDRFALIIAHVWFKQLGRDSRWFKALMGAGRSDLADRLEAARCKLAVAISIDADDNAAQRLDPRTHIEVAWPAMLLHEVREECGFSDNEFEELHRVIEQQRPDGNPRYDAQLCEDLKGGIEQHLESLDKAVGFVRKVRGELDRKDDRPGIPAGYDPDNRLTEAMSIVAAFSEERERMFGHRTFDALVDAILPEGRMPEEYALPRPKLAVREEPPIPPYTINNWNWAVPPPCPDYTAKAAQTWRESWAAEADLRRHGAGIIFPIDKGAVTRLRLTRPMISKTSLRESFPGRLEAAASNLVDRGILASHDELVRNAARRLFFDLRADFANFTKAQVPELSRIISRLIGQEPEKGLGEDEAYNDATLSITQIMDEIDTSAGASFADLAQALLARHAVMAATRPAEAKALTAVLMNFQAAAAAWRSRAGAAEPLRLLIEAAAQHEESCDEVLGCVERQLRVAALWDGTPEPRLEAIRKLAGWLPQTGHVDELKPEGKIALDVVHCALDLDLRWAERTSYNVRENGKSLGSIAFGSDGEKRGQVADMLAAYRLSHLQHLGEHGASKLRERFKDMFWATLHGHDPADTRTLLNHVPRFEAMFTRVLTDDARLPDDTDLPTFYAYLVNQSGHRGDDARLARGLARRIDVFHASLVSEWFFTAFGLTKATLSAENRSIVDAFACELHRPLDGFLAKRIPHSLQLMAQIIDEYGTVLVDLDLTHASVQAFATKAAKLRALARVIASARPVHGPARTSDARPGYSTPAPKP